MNRALYQPNYWHHLIGDFPNRVYSRLRRAIRTLMATVIDALLLAGLYKLFADTALATLPQRVTEMFNYLG